MAEKRMFCKTIIDSDAFLDMPLSSQALYFHLSMRADDDGFLNNAKKILRTIGANQNDYDLLLAKNFIIQFDDGICVIKHWRMHNYIAKDRYKPTIYQEEISNLYIKDNKSYTLTPTNTQLINGVYTTCIQTVDISDTQNRLEEISLDKNSSDKNSSDKNSSEEIIVEEVKVSKELLNSIIFEWNNLGLSKLTKINKGSTRYKSINARINDYGEEAFICAIRLISQSDFLKGINDKGWVITFDWFIKPNNFVKVLEGNYTTRKKVNINGSNEQHTTEQEDDVERTLRKQGKSIADLKEDTDINF
ncbi:MAG: hypothetical protein ACI3T9_02245 [Romboutsia timonensis]